MTTYDKSEIRDDKLYVEGSDQPFIRKKYDEVLTIDDLRLFQNDWSGNKNDERTERPYFFGNATIPGYKTSAGLAIVGSNSEPVLKLQINIYSFDNGDIKDFVPYSIDEKDKGTAKEQFTIIRNEVGKQAQEERNERFSTGWPVSINYSDHNDSWYCSIHINKKVFDNLVAVYRSRLLKSLTINFQIDAWKQESYGFGQLFLKPDDNGKIFPAQGYVSDLCLEEKKLSLENPDKEDTPDLIKPELEIAMQCKQKIEALAKNLRLILWAIIAIGAIIWFKR